MSNNKAKREELEKIYGSGSMFQKSKAEEYVSTLPKIKGYQRYIHEKHFTTKEIINNHIRKWKVDFITLTTEGVQESGQLVQDESTEIIEIPVHTYHRKVDLRRAEERRRRQEKREFNRLRKEMEDR